MVDAHAYGSDSPSGGSTGCPAYSNLLDTQKSSASTGDFIFHIDQQISGYVASYCEQGYAPRKETTNGNLTDNTRVQPDPITLFPISLPGVSPSKLSKLCLQSYFCDSPRLSRLIVNGRPPTCAIPIGATLLKYVAT